MEYPIGRFLKNDPILVLTLDQLIILMLQFLIQAFFILHQPFYFQMRFNPTQNLFPLKRLNNVVHSTYFETTNNILQFSFVGHKDARNISSVGVDF